MKFSIQSKILILSLSCTLLGTLTIGIISTMFINRISQQSSMQILKDEINTEASKLNLLFEEYEKYTQIIPSKIYTQIRQDSLFFTDKKKLSKHIDEIKEHVISTIDHLPDAKTFYVRFNPIITNPNAGLFLVKGNEIEAPFIELPPTNITQYSPSDVEHVGWYYIPIQSGHAMWMQPYHNKNINVYMISYVIPMFIGNTEVGVTGIDIDFGKLSKQIAQIHFFKTGYAYLEDSEGLVIYHPTFPVGLSFKAGEDQVRTSAKLLNGMSLVSIVPTSEINSESHKLILQCAILILLVLIITTAITIFFAKSITRPLKILTEEAKKMVTGDMNVDFKIPSNANDEIGKLARNFTAAKLHINRYMKQMQGLAYRDPLTGVKNKMAYDKHLAELNDKIESGEITTYGIVVLDTNNLKEINDTYGHENGNEYLVNSCKLICQIFAHSPVFRIGGDEFTVTLTGEDLKNHEELLKKLKDSQEHTKNAPFPWRQISIAAGSAIAENAKATTIAETFNKADSEMYQHKRSVKAENNG